MNTFGLRACTGTGGSTVVYLSGGVDVEVDLVTEDVTFSIYEYDLDIGVELFDFDVAAPDEVIDIGEESTDIDYDSCS